MPCCKVISKDDCCNNQVSQERRSVVPGRGQERFQSWCLERVWLVNEGLWWIHSSRRTPGRSVSGRVKLIPHSKTLPGEHTDCVWSICHYSILTFVKGPAGTDHSLGEKPRALGSFHWELPSTEWSRGTLEKQWDTIRLPSQLHSSL